MKRGLKGALERDVAVRIESCRVFPDEEGTERLPRLLKLARQTGLQSIPR